MVIMVIPAKSTMEAGYIADFYRQIGYKTRIESHSSGYSVSILDVDMSLLAA